MEKGFVRSNFKFHCHVCDRIINRGDNIAQIEECGGHYSMTLRTRTVPNNCFYTPDTGARWIHRDCTPSTGWTSYSGLQMAIYENEWIDQQLDM